MRLSDEFRNRTKRFASAIVRFYAKLPQSRKEVAVLGHQLLRAGTSVAAHTREASRARSDAEFLAKIGDSLKELEETGYWLELLVESGAVSDKKLSLLRDETSQLTAILTSIAKKIRSRL